ncbi:MAG: hypothetical protein IPK98_17845 [Chloracidobacterium sp.]|nr:hypothetical protein [Chloracidobacterium sp.]
MPKIEESTDRQKKPMIAENPRVLDSTPIEEFARKYVATIAASEAAIMMTGYVYAVRPLFDASGVSVNLSIIERVGEM